MKTSRPINFLFRLDRNVFQYLVHAKIYKTTTAYARIREIMMVKDYVCFCFLRYKRFNTILSKRSTPLEIFLCKSQTLRYLLELCKNRSSNIRKTDVHY